MVSKRGLFAAAVIAVFVGGFALPSGARGGPGAYV